MRYSVTQGEIVEVNFQLPDNSFKPHPALVLSTTELLEDEDFFYVVLLSTKNIFPKYTLRVTPDMLTKPMSREGFFVTHIIDSYTPDEILRKTNTFVKRAYLPQILAKINLSIFGWNVIQSP